MSRIWTVFYSNLTRGSENLFETAKVQHNESLGLLTVKTADTHCIQSCRFGTRRQTDIMATAFFLPKIKLNNCPNFSCVDIELSPKKKMHAMTKAEYQGIQIIASYVNAGNCCANMKRRRGKEAVRKTSFW